MSEKINLNQFVSIEPKPQIPYTINNITFKITPTVPYEQLLINLQWALLLIMDDNGYIKAPVKRIVTDLVLIKTFTNLDLTRLELAAIGYPEIYELYDIVTSTDILATVKASIDPIQLSFFETTLNETITSILLYRNSAAGVLELLSNKSQELNTDFTSSLEALNDPEKMQNILKLADLVSATA